MERKGFPIANLVAKMEAGKLDAAPVFTDVKTFPYGEFRGFVDILSGGFPCQPFSAAGKRQATEDPRHLFPYIADGIRECQPRIVFLENVQGILSCKTADGEPVLQYVLRTLEGLGYRATAGIFSAEEVGAPHQRKRVFIMAYNNNEGLEGYYEHSASVHRQNERVNSRECSIERVAEELGNTADLRLQQSSADSREAGTDQSGEERRVYESQGASSLSRYGSQQDCSPELADSNNSGGNQDRQPAELWASGIEQSSIHRWPARPGEAQQEWEEPRVVANTKGKQGSSRDNGEESRASSQSEESQSGGGHSGSLRESNGQAESELGRASNGTTRGVDATTNRVDRLRLLGNGVVNQTAAKAFVTLIQRVANK